MATTANERINVQDSAEVKKWAEKLDVTSDQINDAVGAVGNDVADVELHLKGSRATTSADTEKAAESL